MKAMNWEEIITGKGTKTERLKVDGGYLYFREDSWDRATSVMCFVPEIDLKKYESHLRDAYNQGLKDGKYAD